MKKSQSSKSARTSRSAPLRGGRRTSSALNKETRTARGTQMQASTNPRSSNPKNEQEMSDEQ